MKNMKKRIAAIMTTACLAATMLTGCGKGASADKKTASAGKPASAGELNIFVWTEYVPDSVIKAFEDETGIKVNVSTYSSNEDMLAKVKSESAGAYDIVLPSDYMVEQMIGQDMLAELDFEK
nr:extracellular solute-binding protein [Lachnospiraceae bacterium]